VESSLKAAVEVRVDIFDVVLATSSIISVVFVVCIFLSVLLHGFRKCRTRNDSEQSPRRLSSPTLIFQYQSLDLNKM